MDANKIASVFGCTPEQVKRQFKKNAAQLAAMETKAKATGKKVNGFTAAELEKNRVMCEEKSK